MSGASTRRSSVHRLPLAEAAREPLAFAALMRARDRWPLLRTRVRTLQVNVGKRCNQACLHCHVEAGPKRTESMSREIAARVIELLAINPQIELLDITGGAPELNPNFRFLVERARALGRSVIDRCNLTVLLEPNTEGLAAFLAEQRVHVVASLPCYLDFNVDAQRGKGVFERSLAALRLLNALGYGAAGSGLVLDLVYNPVKGTLPPPQAALEADYKRVLAEHHGIHFDNLLTITNVPIARFARALASADEFETYHQLLAESFNASTVPALMCRSLLSVSWDGRLYDCDFNQMAEIALGTASAPRSVWDVHELDILEDTEVATADHCLACTAGHGSSCSGALR